MPERGIPITAFHYLMRGDYLTAAEAYASEATYAEGNPDTAHAFTMAALAVTLAGDPYRGQMWLGCAKRFVETPEARTDLEELGEDLTRNFELGSIT